MYLINNASQYFPLLLSPGMHQFLFEGKIFVIKLKLQIISIITDLRSH